jgi:hypothetical protein
MTFSVSEGFDENQEPAPGNIPALHRETMLRSNVIADFIRKNSRPRKSGAWHRSQVEYKDEAM